MVNLEDRIGEFLVPHLKDFIFEELSESFLEKLGLADVMKGVPVPLRKTELNKITILAIVTTTICITFVYYSFFENQVKRDLKTITLVEHKVLMTFSQTSLEQT